MVGYGPEDSHFVVELTYNYGIKQYQKGNDFQVGLRSLSPILEETELLCNNLFCYIYTHSAWLSIPKPLLRMQRSITGRAHRYKNIHPPLLTSFCSSLPSPLSMHCAWALRSANFVGYRRSTGCGGTRRLSLSSSQGGRWEDGWGWYDIFVATLYTLVVCFPTLDPVYSVTLSISNLTKSLGMFSQMIWSALYSTLTLFCTFSFLCGPYWIWFIPNLV